ncbi:sugar transferase [Marinivivus vitaminiproducens]|uniref:sugar transferase n=1 Tax=Marinivivus vitaminiproducens TaxID=3035935 RepID=UPI00279DAE02|nr:sugar transferase [Geminicoccaceae bacterium SCSIO 64248]
MKRLFDIVVAATALVALAPVIGVILALVWLQDRHSPFYVASRIGRGGRPFRMVKIRSMIVRAERSGVYSTSTDDNRITPLGRVIRRCKLDELTQFWNVLIGDMSLVGPRPTVALDVALYTDLERSDLGLRPGITSLAAIVFADEAEIIAGSADPDLDYMQKIRPWKSRMNRLYAERATLLDDVQVVALTGLAIVKRRAALDGCARMLAAMDAPAELVTVARRRDTLHPVPPPGRPDPISAAEVIAARRHVTA